MHMTYDGNYKAAMGNFEEGYLLLLEDQYGEASAKLMEGDAQA